ncbi:biopolymer transporter ExbD [Epibacterium ulvae]|uniref:ExbD/TolR family protein n=1 Tax=Epibacterium ulvae TaxID=1156985 RepID=UPI001BFC6F8D|nr:biopolymer transporter ExbD [Epibacterium ulvae]MBT8155631.1 biopolymer transporter ExbD [Epibacterium ulvae]
MRRRSITPPRRKPEPTIALINIVFLMLVFFLVAGTLTQPLEPELELIDTATLDGAEPPDALVITAQGALRFRGAHLTDSQAYMDTLTDDAPARILPDRAAPAVTLVAVAQDLRNRGATDVLIITQRSPNEAAQ